MEREKGRGEGCPVLAWKWVSFGWRRIIHWKEQAQQGVGRVEAFVNKTSDEKLRHELQVRDREEATKGREEADFRGHGRRSSSPKRT